MHPRASTGQADPGPYRAPRWLSGGHAQTIWPYFVRRPDVPFRRERVDTRDGDFWTFDWLAHDARPDAPLIVLFHGLEGGSGSHYSRALMIECLRTGYRAVVPHFRGCAGEENRLPRAYHSGDHEEVEAMLTAVRARTQAPVLHAVGVSLGGSALLNWAGRKGVAASGVVASLAAVSAPLDLMAAGLAIGRGLNRIYAYHFLATLKPKAMGLAKRFPGSVDVGRVRRARSMWEFDDVVTAPLHGFAGTEDYWTRASSKRWLQSIGIPTLVLNARNDPFIPGASLPRREEVSANVVLEQPADGGHAGFPIGPAPGTIDWLPRRLLHFFEGSTAKR